MIGKLKGIIDSYGEDFVILADPEGKLFCVVGLDRSKYWREDVGERTAPG